MSEFINTQHRGFRWKLLSSVSALALSASLHGIGGALAADADRPTVWIEGGWHADSVGGGQQLFDPTYMNTIAQDGLSSPLNAQNTMSYGYGAEGELSFQPEDSDWIFQVSARYGHALGNKKAHQEKVIPPTYFTIKYHTVQKTAPNDYADFKIGNSANHVIADFQAGKDVGLGLFGHGGSSTFGFGVRFAQFTETASNLTYARPDNHFVQAKIFTKYIPVANYHHYTANVQRQRSFTGLGPAISWSNSSPVIGSDGGGNVALDWGINAALLFGRQKAKVHSQLTSDHHYFVTSTLKYKDVSTHDVGGGDRKRTIVVPNLGGFAGLSLNWSNAKISLGYRADFFFGAIDGGVDTRRNINRSFYGPFASVSIGIGG